MAGTFDYFVILAVMRTGSNLLEELLNAADGVSCYGEIFNPAFAGHAHKSDLFGMRPAEIAADPAAAIELLKKRTAGIPGFRLFKDQNPKALDHCLSDPKCAKVILRRSPVASYVSLKIARATDQWRVNDLKAVKRAKATYDSGEFSAHLSETSRFYRDAVAHLQKLGQTGFHLRYDDLLDDDVIAGLLRYLGAPGAPRRGKRKTKKQNPEPIAEKVSNYAQMARDLARFDPIGLFDEPDFEDERGPNVSGFVADKSADLMFMPIKAGPSDEIIDWMARLDPSDPGSPVSGLTQKELRQWKRQRPGHRSFTVVRHPVKRALAGFIRHLVEPGDENFSAIRQTLGQHYGVQLPKVGPIETVDQAALATGLLGFLDFVKGNLAGQTTVRVDGAWASQTVILQGMSRFGLPDVIIREDELGGELTQLCAKVGCDAPEVTSASRLDDLLSQIYSEKIEKAARAAYQKDYTNGLIE